MRQHRGWIVLDIDGTITDETHHAPPEVVAYLHSLRDQGWELVFITGRTFSFAFRAMQAFDFPYFLAVQNGADILWMPKRELVVRHYLEPFVIEKLEEIYTGEKEDFLLYAGYDRGDFCYYRPQRFSPRLQEHLKVIMSFSPEPWKEVADFRFPCPMYFPLIKCLGSQEAMQKMHTLLETMPGVAASMIKDPLAEEIYLNLVTSSDATKGKAFRAVAAIIGKEGPVIAAGDDTNDIPMLQEADLKIVMGTAPKSMHPLADILAKSGQERGIIDALKEAVKRI